MVQAAAVGAGAAGVAALAPLRGGVGLVHGPRGGAAGKPGEISNFQPLLNYKSIAELIDPRSQMLDFSMYQSGIGFKCPYSNRP